jgi:hypothetical protein
VQQILIPVVQFQQHQTRMTPDQKFTLWIAAVTTLPTVVFAGAVAYWNWKRDQERIVVRKSPSNFNAPDETQSDATQSSVGVAVTNLSLFPVRIVGMGFRMDGKYAWTFDRDKHDEKEWPLELASHARMIVFANPAEWKQLEALGVRDRAMEWKFVAVAVTQTGSRFFSSRFRAGITRQLQSSRRWLNKSLSRLETTDVLSRLANGFQNAISNLARRRNSRTP